MGAWASSPSSAPEIKALLFDVFGTCVDWRTTVTDALAGAAKEALESPTGSLSEAVRSKAAGMTREDWRELADEWRVTYLVFTRSLADDPSLPYKTVDQHHLDALREILTERGLLEAGSARGSLWTDSQVVDLSLIWHRLNPWPDTSQGLRELNRKFTTCSLSNGNISLLQDMVKRADMPFTHVFSAEIFQSYKPSPKVYLGAVKKLGLQPGECCMVAAHLDDLKFAKANGLRTVYVERPQEERYPELRDEKGIVDVWVSEHEDGFKAAARKLGVGTVV